MFSGTEPLAILDFLDQYTLQRRDIGFPVNEVHLSIHSFLCRQALGQLKDAKENTCDGEDVYSWPSGVKFILRAYFTDVNIE